MNLANASISVAVFHPNISNPNPSKDVVNFYNSSGDMISSVPLTPQNPTLAAGLALSNPSRAMFRGIDCMPASFTVADNTELRVDVSINQNGETTTCTITTVRP